MGGSRGAERGAGGGAGGRAGGRACPSARPRVPAAPPKGSATSRGGRSRRNRPGPGAGGARARGQRGLRAKSLPRVSALWGGRGGNQEETGVLGPLSPPPGPLGEAEPGRAGPQRRAAGAVTQARLYAPGPGALPARKAWLAWAAWRLGRPSAHRAHAGRAFSSGRATIPAYTHTRTHKHTRGALRVRVGRRCGAAPSVSKPGLAQSARAGSEGGCRARLEA